MAGGTSEVDAAAQAFTREVFGMISVAAGGPGLGTMWGRELATRMFHDAGFSTVEERPAPTDDAINTIYVCKP